MKTLSRIMLVFILILMPTTLSLSSQISVEPVHQAQETKNRTYLLSQKEFIKSLKPKHPKIGIGLQQYIEQTVSDNFRTGERAIDQKSKAPEKFRVIFYTSGHTEKTLDRMRSYGAKILYEQKDLIAAEVPEDKLEAITNDIEEIQYARSPFKFFSHAVKSEGVDLTRANRFHDIGFTGAGVKVAVIDNGFKGLTDAHLNGEIPYGVVTHDFTGKGMETKSLHGTACAEIIHDIAPDSELVLLKVRGESDIYAALDYCVDHDVDIINFSMGTSESGPGNGTGPLDEAFDEVRANGILAVVSAGNKANRKINDVWFGSHWKGEFYDTDGDDIHEFTNGLISSSYNIIGALPYQDDDGNPSEEDLVVVMRWDDWPTADIDYDIYLYDYGQGEIKDLVTQSDVTQNGSQPPLEVITVDLPDTQEDVRFFALVVSKPSGEPAGTELELFVSGNAFFVPRDTRSRPFATSESSITEPADAESVLAVGAFHFSNWQSGSQEDFSSQGPTNAWAGSEARIKPDICGPDGVSTYTYGETSYKGTSAAAPHVVGFAALTLSMSPEMNVDELYSFIINSTQDSGSKDKDNIYGWGKLNSLTPVVKSTSKISELGDNFIGKAGYVGDAFGSSVTAIGDLNSDGIIDIAVGAPHDDDGYADQGAVWIFFLNSDGSIQSYQKISAKEGNFAGKPEFYAHFGASVASIGDLNNDGIIDLSVGAPGNMLRGSQQGGAVWILFLNPDGTVQSHQKISALEGNFSGDLDEDDRFGISVSGIGDLNNDGTLDLAVGAFGDDDGDSDQGAIWILILNPDGTVKSHQKISETEGNFTADIDRNDHFGRSVASIGDINKDGISDLAVGAYNDDDGEPDKGAVWILFLNSDGTVKSHQKISATEGNFTGDLNDYESFGISLVSIGDLDSDSIQDIGVNSYGEWPKDLCAFWILFMNRDGTVKSHQKIDPRTITSASTSDGFERFGCSMASIGDIDGNGNDDLAIGNCVDYSSVGDKGTVYISFLNSLIPDKDKDAIPDSWEIAHGLNPDLNDSGNDPDDDGYTHLMEFKAKTDPFEADSDDDGITDGDEDKNHNQILDPGETHALWADTNGDGTKDGVTDTNDDNSSNVNNSSSSNDGNGGGGGGCFIDASAISFSR